MNLEMVLWNAGLSIVLGFISWTLKDKANELSRLQILLNRTREEVAKE